MTGEAENTGGNARATVVQRMNVTQATQVTQVTHSALGRLLEWINDLIEVTRGALRLGAASSIDHGQRLKLQEVTDN